MTEPTGIVRAIEVLGDEIKKHEAALRHVMNQRDDLKREAAELREQNKELAERLKQAEADRDAACSYALQLERLLEECRKAYNGLQELQEGIPEPKKGGADNCKKS